MEQFQQRDYQIRIINKTLKAIEDGHRNILIESATGSGKTLIALLIAKTIQETKGWKIGWTTMRKHLLIQAKAENEKFLDIKDINYFSTWTKEPPKDIDLYFEDECQHNSSPTATELYKQINPKIIIGLTATPFRTDKMKLCFSKVIKDAGIRSLIDAGWLSPYHQYIVNGPWTPEVVANTFIADVDRWGKSVMYFLTEVECDRCAELLREANIKCEVVTGSSDQESQIDSFNHGDTQVLLNMVVLTEGFDSQILKTVWVRPGSKGPTIQMSGRAFRKHPSKPFAQIVQNNTTSWPFVKIASAEQKFTQGEDGRWENRQYNDKVMQAQHAAIMAISQITVDLPPLIKKFHKKNFYAQFAQGI